MLWPTFPWFVTTSHRPVSWHYHGNSSTPSFVRSGWISQETPSKKAKKSRGEGGSGNKATGQAEASSGQADVASGQADVATGQAEASSAEVAVE
jgi:hypothetical protein